MQIAIRSFTLRLALAALTLLTFGCAGLVVEPASARPGTTVRIRASRPVFQSPNPSVQIGGRPAALVRRGSDHEVDVIVPVADAGRSRVRVGSGGWSRRGRVTLLPAPSVELLIALEGSSVKLVRATPRAGEATARALRDQARLSYDVINRLGGLVYTGVIVDPTRREVFDGPDAKNANLHGTAPSGSAVFAVKVPNVPGRFSVKLYRLGAGIDLATEAGRAQRVPLGELTVEKKETP
jgi:hypothetical protein